MKRQIRQNSIMASYVLDEYVNIDDLQNICNELRSFLDSVSWPDDDEMDDDDLYDFVDMLETMQSAWEEAYNLL